MKAYATPAAFKSALEHRLRTLARVRGQDMNRVRQVLIFERLVARLAMQFGDELVVKGGLALELRLDRARSTRDVDLRVLGDPASVLERVREAGRLELEDHLSFEIGSTLEVLDGDGLVYDGIRLRVTARLASRVYGAPFGLDLAFGDVLTSSPEWIEGSTTLQFAGIEPRQFLVYPRVTHIAEKLHAYSLPRPTENSRLKDLPDIGLLANDGPIGAVQLREALEATFTFRASHALPEAIAPPPASWEAPYLRLARSEGMPWNQLEELHAAVAGFLNPVLAGKKVSTWNPTRWQWE